MLGWPDCDTRAVIRGALMRADRTPGGVRAFPKGDPNTLELVRGGSGGSCSDVLSPVMLRRGGAALGCE